MQLRLHVHAVLRVIMPRGAFFLPAMAAFRLRLLRNHRRPLLLLQHYSHDLPCIYFRNLNVADAAIDLITFVGDAGAAVVPTARPARSSGLL